MKQSLTFSTLFYLICSISSLFPSAAHAQETKPEEATLPKTEVSSNKDEKPKEPAKPTIKINPFDGVIVAGYVDNGAFLNFTGPNISLTYKSSKILLGMLPSLRYKEDNGIFKNSPITPSLGFGLTYSYKKIAVQVPIYYNAKTATANGRWNLGIGIGMRLK